MKEIKAYIRRDEINEVVERLQRAGAPGVSVIEIHSGGCGYAASPFEPHRALPVDRYRYLTIVKLEVMCADEQLDRLVDVIRTSCGTGNPGDGMVFVSDIVDAMRLREGARGEAALRSSPTTASLGRAHDRPSPGDTVAAICRGVKGSGRAQLGSLRSDLLRGGPRWRDSPHGGARHAA